jgi:hypothetical protein
MKRPLKPVTQTEEERRRERRFTRRLLLLAGAGCLVGLGLQAFRAMGRPPPPAGVPPAPSLADSPPSLPGCGAAPQPPRPPGK